MTVAAFAALTAAPTIAYCVDENEAHRLVDEVIADASSDAIAVDFETTPLQPEVGRLAMLRTELATVRG